MSNEAIPRPTGPTVAGPPAFGQNADPGRQRRRATARRLASFGLFLRTERLGALSLAFIALIVFVAVFAPLIAPYDPLVQNRLRISEAPSGEYLLGTDDLGRDILSRLIYGARSPMIIGVATTGISLMLGTVLGIVSGFLGRGRDLVIQRTMDAIESVPPLVLLLFLAVVLTPSIQGTIIALVVVITPSFNRVARAETLRIREEFYIEAARATGAGTWRIMTRHVLPNMVAPLLTMSSLLFAGVLIAESALSFLGIGTPPPTPSWGLMLSDGVRYTVMAPWMVIAPGIVLSMAVFAFNLLVDSLRDFLDPRLQR